MPDQRLIVGGIFDPRGILSGIDTSVDAIKRLESQVQALASHLPTITPEDLVGGIIDGVKDAIADLKALQAEAARTQEAVVAPFRIIKDKVAELKTLAGQGFVPPTPPAPPTGPTDAAAASAAKMALGWQAAGEAGRRAFADAQAWSRGIDALTRASQSNLTATERMAVGWAAASRTGRQAFENGQASTRMIQGMSQAALGGAASVTRLGHSNSQTAQHFVNMAAATLGADTAIARLAATVLSLSIGFTRIAIGAGIIFGLAKVWELVTRASREAKKEQDELVKGIQERAKAERAGNREAGVAAIRERITALREERELQEQMNKSTVATAAAVGLWLLGLRHVGKEQELIRDLMSEQRRIVHETLEARRDAGRALLQDELAITRAAIEGAEAHARARLSIAEASGQRTFGAQPDVISNEQKASFDIRIKAAKDLAAAQINIAIAERFAAAQSLKALQVDKNATDAQKVAAQGQVDAITHRILLMQQELGIRVQAIRDEEELARTTAKTAIALEGHLRRVQEAGGGNILGATPRSLLAGQTAFPSPAELEERRKAAIPPIQQGRIQQGLDSQKIGYAGLTEAIRKARVEAERLRQAELDARTPGEVLGDALLNFGNLAFGIADVASGIGLIGQQSAQVIGSVGALGNALAEVAKRATFGNILGAVQTGIGVVGSLFGESPEERAMREELKRVREELVKFRVSLDASLQGSQGLVKTRQILGIEHPSRIDMGSLTQVTTDEFNRALDAAGLTLEEFAAAVEEQTGIDILDEKGRILAGQYEIARDKIDLMSQAASHFGTTIADQERRISNRNRIFGVEGSAIQDNRTLLLENLNLDQIFGAGFEERIRALDLDTEEGRRAYRAFLQQIYQMAAAGKLAGVALGQFENVDQVIDVAADGADAVAEAEQEAADKIKEAADKAAEALAQFNEAVPTLISLRSKITGADADPAAVFRDLLEQLAFAGSNLFGMIGNVDVSDPETRRLVRKRLLEIVDTLLGGADAAAAMGILPEQVQPLIDFISQAVDALDELDESAKVAAKSLGEIEAVGTLRARLQGKDTTEAFTQFQIALDSLAELAPDFAEQFGGLDLSSADIRDAFRKRLLSLLDAGGELPEGLTREDFLQFLGEGADVLDSFNKKVEDATKSLTNMPRGFNLALAEFRAQAADRSALGREVISTPPITTLPPRSPVAPTPPSLTDPGNLPRARPIDGMITETVVQWTGDIVLNEVPQNGRELARIVKDVFKRSDAARFGPAAPISRPLK